MTTSGHHILIGNGQIEVNIFLNDSPHFFRAISKFANIFNDLLFIDISMIMSDVRARYGTTFTS